MKVKLFTAPSNISCQKAISWLDQYEIPYEEKNLSKAAITSQEIQEILSLTTEGTEENISKKSKAFEKLGIDLNTLSFPQLYEVLMSNLDIFHLPAIHDGKRLRVSYKEEDIRKFLPRWFQLNELRKIISFSSKG